MRAVDRIAVEEFGLGILQMMENAGRVLAEHVMAVLGPASGEVTVLAGPGGNGGGGLCCARHLHNRGLPVSVVLDRQASALGDAARAQLRILRAAGLGPIEPSGTREVVLRSRVVVDALIGYSLRGAPRGATADLIDLCRREGSLVVSLDVPSGLDASTGQVPGPVVHAARTVTLALPKIGLAGIPGEIYLADIGIPPQVFHRLGIFFPPPFRSSAWVRLVTNGPGAQRPSRHGGGAP
ncbi:MAG: NAD(P)H-hydrate epimerase [Armatimonadetes bacterium]|nr:NAD(P)H-hydrate epimerase [Armatimonadota bacterium]